MQRPAPHSRHARPSPQPSTPASAPANTRRDPSRAPARPFAAASSASTSALAALLLSSPLAAQAIPASQLLIRDTTPGATFRWTAPAEAALEPVLLAALRADGARARAEFRRAAAPIPGRRPPALLFSVTTVAAAAETAPLLATTATTASYTGGAHGNANTSVTWFDRRTKRILSPSDLFTDWPRAEAAIRAAYCPALNAERATRRGGQSAGLPDFDKCPQTTELSIAPAPTTDRIFALRLTADPYVAGPYAEGAYAIDLPVTPALLALVKPAYRFAFQAR